MPTVGQASRILSRYNDILGIVAVLPLVSHVKFGGLIEAQEASKKHKKEETAEGSTSSKLTGNRSPGKESGYLPPAWALFLILIAELCSAIQLFDSSDRQVRRGIGELLRAQRQSRGSTSNLLGQFERLLANDDVYELVRFFGAFCSCCSLFVSALLGLDRTLTLGGQGAYGMLREGLRRFLRTFWRPRLLCLVVLLASLAVGHASALMRFARKPAVKELATFLPVLLRAMGLSGVATSTQTSEHLLSYVGLQCCAALAREAHVLVYNRVTVPELIEGGGSRDEADLVRLRTLAAAELWAVLVLLSRMLSKRRLMTLWALAMPSVALAFDSPRLAYFEPYLDLIIKRMGLCTAVLSLIVLFLGGFQSMFGVVVMGQVLTRIHKLDTLKF
mmetsp:Transcript_40266/g.93678  ORF Transcript_40266/g.93678 Transcript_40266/m.93678 type:complete len:389 (+) Transcript_40266:68-1234(+)